jgi:hypothetical protein
MGRQRCCGVPGMWRAAMNPVDLFELRIFEMTGDVEIACEAGDLMRHEIERGVMTEERVARFSIGWGTQ